MIFSPIISQCPVIVSFPTEASLNLVKKAPGCSTLLTTGKSSILPNPNFSKLGNDWLKPSNVCFNVCEPSSLKAAASGASPIPTESMTIKCTLLNGVVIFNTPTL